MTNKIAAGILTVGMFFALGAPVASAALTEGQITSILSLLTSFGADATTIANVDASLRGNAPVGNGNGGGSSASVCPYTWTRSLTTGDSGADVLALQKFLNATAATSIAASGIGSAGNETDYFGGLTANAVAKFQDMYASEVLAPVGLSAGTGYFGASTRAKANALCVSGSTNPGTPTVPVTGAGLNVLLASDSPNNVALVQGQAIAQLAKFNFVNNNSAAMKVTGLTFNRIGVSTDSSIDNVYLYMGETRLTDSAGISNSQFSFNDTTGIFTIPAGSSVSVSVRADIDSAANGQQIGVSLVSVGADGTLSSSSVFPINGYTQTVSSASIATVALGSITPAGSTLAPGDSTTVFQQTVTVGTRAVNLKSLTLENRGSSNDSDFRNFKLFVRGVQVGNVASIVDDRVTFDLSSAPTRMETGGNDVRVEADIIGGSGETFDFQVRRYVDIQAIDTDLNQPILATGTKSGTANTIEGVALSVSKAATSPTSDVAVDASNVVWGKWEFRATGDDLKIEQITVTGTTSGAAGLDNGKIFLNGVQVGSTNDIADAGTTFSLGSQMIIKAGETAIVEVQSDAKKAAGTSYSSGNTVLLSVAVAAADTEGVDSGDSVSAVSATAANQITITSSALTGGKASGYGNQTMLEGTNGALIGSFTLSTGSTEGINVNTIAIDFASAVSTTLTNLVLKDGSTILGTKTSVGTSNSFAVTGGLNIPASSNRTINVYADIKTAAGAGAIPAATVTTSTTGIGASTGTSVSLGAAVTLQTITLGSATLTATVSSGNTPYDTNVLAGSAGVKVGAFKFDAQSSLFNVEKIKVKVPADAATAITGVTLKYKNAAGTTVESSADDFDIALASGETHATATFTGLTMFVPKDGTALLDVYVGVATVAAQASVVGKTISVSLDAGEGFLAKDSAGNEDTTLAGADLSSTASSGRGSLIVRESVPTLSKVALSNSALSAGSNKAIGKVRVTADAAGSIAWKKLVFSVEKTAALTLGATTTIKLHDAAGNAIAGTFATTTGSHASQSQAFTTAATSGTLVFVATSEQEVSAGSSEDYELRATVGGIASGYNYINVSVPDTSTSAATAAFATIHSAVGDSSESFVWSDQSAAAHSESTTDWTNDYLVDDLSLDLGTISVTI